MPDPLAIQRLDHYKFPLLGFDCPRCNRHAEADVPTVPALSWAAGGVADASPAVGCAAGVGDAVAPGTGPAPATAGAEKSPGHSITMRTPAGPGCRCGRSAVTGWARSKTMRATPGSGWP